MRVSVEFQQLHLIQGDAQQQEMLGVGRASPIRPGHRG